MSLVQAITAPPQITAALQQASAKTGTDFNYLLKTAMRESSLDCNAKSSTSSACGLFQFTEQSWLGTMKQDGADLGLGRYADSISQDSRGRYVVTDPAARREILALRKDPEISALMAGAYTNDSRDRLESRLGRSVNGGELYIAHFLGAGGASKLISSAEETPQTPADELFPAAAAANRSIFYGRDGTPRTAAEVYDNLVAKHRNTNGGAPNVQTMADANSAASARSSARADYQPTSFQSFSTAISHYSSSYSEIPSYAAMIAPDMATGTSGALTRLGGRSPLTLSPGVVQLLASLDVPETAHSDDETQDKPENRDVRNDRITQQARLADSPSMLPLGGSALG
jgi:hypothetical protein